jgi:hypothetical protein
MVGKGHANGFQLNTRAQPSPAIVCRRECFSVDRIRSSWPETGHCGIYIPLGVVGGIQNATAKKELPDISVLNFNVDGYVDTVSKLTKGVFEGESIRVILEIVNTRPSGTKG